MAEDSRREKDLSLVEEFETVRAITSDGRSVQVPKSKFGGNLEVASANVLGGIKADEKSDSYTQEVKIDPLTGKLFVPQGEGTPPDDEDITVAEIEGTGKLQFKDKKYNASSFSGMGRKFLRKNMVGGVNVLTQTAFNNEDGTSGSNTRFVVQYDYDLNGATINIPRGCVLDFQGGSIINGSLAFQNTLLSGEPRVYCNVSGSVSNDKIIGNWFLESFDFTDLYKRGVFNLKGFSTIKFEYGNYTIDSSQIKYSSYQISNSNITIDGCGSVVSALQGEHVIGCILLLNNCSNIVVENFVLDGGVDDSTKFVADTARHNVIVASSYDVIVRNIVSQKALTDGLYLSLVKNLFVENVFMDGNGRLGCALISGENVHIKSSRFENSYGNSPASGLDIEPNNNSEVLKNISIDDCIFRNNQNCGLTIALNMLKNEVSKIGNVSISITNCKFDNNDTGLNFTSDGNTGYGNIRIYNCSIDDHRKTGVTLKNYSAVNTPHIYFEKNTIRNINTSGGSDVREETCSLGIFCTYAGLKTSIGNVSILNCKFIQEEKYVPNIKTAVNFYRNSISGTDLGFSNVLYEGNTIDIGETNISDITLPDNYDSGTCSFRLEKTITISEGDNILYWRLYTANRFVITWRIELSLTKKLKPVYFDKIEFAQSGSIVYGLFDTTVYNNVYYENGIQYVDGDKISGSFTIYNNKSDYKIILLDGSVSRNGNVVYTKKSSYNGSTPNRPNITSDQVNKGFQYFDTNLGKPIWWTGDKWVDATGTEV